MLYAQRRMPMNSTCMCWGFECGDGWFGLLDRLSAKLEAINQKGQFKIEASQVKEKFGSLRFYTNGAPDEADKLISKAEKESARTCERCGKRGKIMSNVGWYTCLCQKHSPKLSPHKAKDALDASKGPAGV